MSLESDGLECKSLCLFDKTVNSRNFETREELDLRELYAQKQELNRGMFWSFVFKISATQTIHLKL